MRISTSILWVPAAVALCAVSGCSKDRTGEAARTETAAPPSAETAPATAPTSPGGTADTAPADTTAAPSTAGTSSDASSGSGAQVYETYCVTCHGAQGKGDGPAAAALTPKPADFATNSFRLDPNGNGTKGEVDDIKAVVHDGAAKYGGSPLMAPWPALTPDQLQAVAEHVKSLASG